MTTPVVRLALADITATLCTRFDVLMLLEKIATTAHDAYGARGVVIGLLDDGGELHTAVTTPVAQAAVHGPLLTEGPILESARETAVAVLADTGSTVQGRWRTFAETARAAGVGAVRAYPITSLGVGLGSLAVHAAQPWDTDRPDDVGATLADLAALALTIGTDDDRRRRPAAAIREVLSTAARLAAATGVVAEVFGDDVGDARARLRTLARARGLSDAAYAGALVELLDRMPERLAGNPLFDEG
ncbi:GAF domain-containing protein [Rhodococcoides corynebacterioides]|uniref:GAF domain-containing protein n=1 Tax=Rhodococcoides corynebacterioides TaxID=53972 RepID=A0ABS7P7V4_9NOCA|nr:GAF domain-containing protein [Rhodococcus corynebacterioides]MBY6368126.1 hypothetical protein [Rhodococcus corynebacterioides]MBY6409880.1 hypothetical protein [Rhodococcus corynebacterioides]